MVFFGVRGNKNHPQPADRPLKSPDAASVNVPPKTAEVSEKTAVRLGILTDGCRLSPPRTSLSTNLLKGGDGRMNSLSFPYQKNKT